VGSGGAVSAVGEINRAARVRGCVREGVGAGVVAMAGRVGAAEPSGQDAAYATSMGSVSGSTK
jgi:hypothetical protein